MGITRLNHGRGKCFLIEFARPTALVAGQKRAEAPKPGFHPLKLTFVGERCAQLVDLAAALVPGDDASVKVGRNAPRHAPIVDLPQRAALVRIRCDINRVLRIAHAQDRKWLLAVEGHGLQR